MKIQRITPYNITTHKNIKKRENNNTNYNIQPQLTPQVNLPSTQNYLSFTGGYSLDLAKTIERLDALAQKKTNLYPPNIRQWAGMVLENGNKENNTLIDIHKKFYESLKECFSIAEVKKKFPEFKDVLSDNDVEFTKNSIVSSIKNDELEFFDKEEDVSLQLLKLYWGDGFSLNDLKKYTNGIDLYHTIKRLNIPTVDRDYGHILKISDPDYNERLVREMKAKRRASLDRKAQEIDKEPVYMPKGPLSAEHKQHISESLKRFYQENPERIYSMSERQKEFYRQNPEKAEELSRVLKKAWNIFGADRIKSALSKFMKKNKESDFNPTGNPVNFTKRQSDLMAKFWDINEWAKKSFSKNMKYAWKKVKEENETFFYLRTSPKQLTKYIEEKEGLATGALKAETKFNPFLQTSSIDEESDKIFTKNIKAMDGIENVMADTYQVAVLEILNKLKEMKKRDQSADVLLSHAIGIVRNNMAGKTNGYIIQSTEEARKDYVALAAHAATSRNTKLLDIVHECLDDAFEIALSSHPDFVQSHTDLMKSILK